MWRPSPQRTSAIATPLEQPRERSGRPTEHSSGGEQRCFVAALAPPRARSVPPKQPISATPFAFATSLASLVSAPARPLLASGAAAEIGRLDHVPRSGASVPSVCLGEGRLPLPRSLASRARTRASVRLLAYTELTRSKYSF